MKMRIKIKMKMERLNNVVVGVLVLVGLGMVGGCDEEVLPVIRPSDQINTVLPGSWISDSRSVTVYKRNDNLDVDPTGNSWFYYDSTYTETIDHRFTFGVESRADSVLIEVTTFNEDGSANEPEEVSGIWKSGEITDPEGPFSQTGYFLVLNANNIHETENGYFRTYTIREIQSNTMTVSYSNNNRRDRDSKLFNLTFTKQ